MPDGSPNQISDWALAGVIWSDASLTQRLATEAAKQAETPEQAEELRTIARQSSQLIEALESFGWRQVGRTAQPTSNDAVRNRERESGSTPLPSPEAVGRAIADSLDPGAVQQASATSSASTGTPDRRSADAVNREAAAMNREAAALPQGLKR
ncbi:signal peptide protein, partial [Rhodopirellula maiorica SM1]